MDWRRKLSEGRAVLGILHGSRAFGGPVQLSFGLSNRCNLRCAHCYYYSPEADRPNMSQVRRAQHHGQPMPDRESIARLQRMDADAERVRTLVREAAALGTRRFLFTGNGEPLMHPDALELMALAKATGSFCALNTNGHLLDRDACEALVEMEFDELRVNALAGTRRTYGQTHRGVTEAGFDRLRDNLLYLAEAKRRAGTRRPRVALVQVVIGPNHDGLLDFARFAAEVDAEEVQYRSFFDTGDPGLARVAPTEQQADQVMSSLPEAKAYLDSRGIAENTRYFAWTFGRQLDTAPLYHTIPCYYGWLMSRVDVDGNVYFCCRCYDPLGNVDEESFRDIWLGEQYRRARARAVTIHRRGTPVEGCDCYSCVHHTANFRAYRALHPIRGREKRLDRLISGRRPEPSPVGT